MILAVTYPVLHLNNASPTPKMQPAPSENKVNTGSLACTISTEIFCLRQGSQRSGWMSFNCRSQSVLPRSVDPSIRHRQQLTTNYLGSLHQTSGIMSESKIDSEHTWDCKCTWAFLSCEKREQQDRRTEWGCTTREPSQIKENDRIKLRKNAYRQTKTYDAKPYFQGLRGQAEQEVVSDKNTADDWFAGFG